MPHVGGALLMLCLEIGVPLLLDEPIHSAQSHQGICLQNAFRICNN
jgi:hypothetical protein